MNRKPQRKPEVAPAAICRRTPALNDTQRWDHWWRRSPFMVLGSHGYYVARPGAEFWYENFWKPRMFSAWVYELVRRLIKFDRGIIKLSEEARALLQAMPTYSQLGSMQKQRLAALVASQFTDHLPDDMLGTSASWRKGQPYKLGDWRQIEILDVKPSRVKSKAQEQPYVYALRYLPLICAAWKIVQFPDELAFAESTRRHDLSDCTFRSDRIKRIVLSVLRSVEPPCSGISLPDP